MAAGSTLEGMMERQVRLGGERKQKICDLKFDNMQLAHCMW